MLCFLSLTLSSFFSPTFITALQKIIFTNNEISNSYRPNTLKDNGP